MFVLFACYLMPEEKRTGANYSLPQGQIAPAQRQAMSVTRHVKNVCTST